MAKRPAFRAPVFLFAWACVFAAVFAAGTVAPTTKQQIVRTPQTPAPPVPPRDRVPPPVTGTSTLKGKVVDAATGAGISRARVRLSGGTRSPVMTDGEGAFEFTRLPAASYFVMVEKTSYLPGRYPDVARSLRAQRQALSIAEGQIQSVAIPMFRAGVIVGRVLDAYGEPVEYASVNLILVPRGSTRPQTRGSFQTNDLGEFRLPRLDAGRYYLAAGPRQLFMDDGVQNPQPLAEPLPTYYPSGASLDQAQPINVQRGQTVSGIDIALAEGTPSLVTGIVVGIDGQPQAGNGSISARLVGAEPSISFNRGGTGIRPDGTFRMQLSAGEYVLETRVMERPPAPGTAPRPNSERFGSARVSVAAGTPLEGVVIPIGRGASASGKVVFEVTGQPPQVPGPISVPLFSQDNQGCRSGQAIVSPDWTFKVDGLWGTCSAPPQAMFGRWTLKSATRRGENLLEKTITFENGQHIDDVQLVFTDRRTELTLEVTGDDGAATRDYVALIFPTEKERWSQLSRYLRTWVSFSPQTMPILGRGGTPIPGTGRVETPGAAQPRRDVIVGLPLGEYYAIALDDIAGEESRDLAVLEKLIPSASRISLTDVGSTEIALRVVKLSDIIRH
jgi:hypothetical protein